MEDLKHFDVIIIGGSYAGLSAAMTLGRALKKALLIDSGKPCNRHTAFAHNFITHDGNAPGEILESAKKQISLYENVHFHNGLAVKGSKTEKGFDIQLESGALFSASKLIFATGIKDIMPDIPGFAECWGISVVHCPYCHGYEIRNKQTGILGNGVFAYEFSKMIYNWTKNLTLFTNGASTLTEEQRAKLHQHNIEIVEKEIADLEQCKGQIKQIVFKDDSTFPLEAIYTTTGFVQNCGIPQQLGCVFTEEGYIEIDAFQKTNIDGVYACGDNTTEMRTISWAVAMGTMAAARVNKEIIDEAF